MHCVQIEAADVQLIYFHRHQLWKSASTLISGTIGHQIQYKCAIFIQYKYLFGEERKER